MVPIFQCKASFTKDWAGILTIPHHKRQARCEILHRVHMGEVKNTCKIFVGNFEEEKPFVTARRMWEDNIRKHLREIRWKYMD
jgi:hypothetical protein